MLVRLPVMCTGISFSARIYVWPRVGFPPSFVTVMYMLLLMCHPQEGKVKQVLSRVIHLVWAGAGWRGTRHVPALHSVYLMVAITSSLNVVTCIIIITFNPTHMFPFLFISFPKFIYYVVLFHVLDTDLRKSNLLASQQVRLCRKSF